MLPSPDPLPRPSLAPPSVARSTPLPFPLSSPPTMPMPALYWKIVSDSCPLRCSGHPWNVDGLPDLRATPLLGFLQCPHCDRLGCLRCHSSSCRAVLEFSPREVPPTVDFYDRLGCPTCPPAQRQRRVLHVAQPHMDPRGEPCPSSSGSGVIYFYAGCCDQMSCGCDMMGPVSDDGEGQGGEDGDGDGNGDGGS